MQNTDLLTQTNTHHTLMRTSHCLENDLIESIPDPESGVLQSFGFSLDSSFILYLFYIK